MVFLADRMVLAWKYNDAGSDDPRDLHQFEPNQEVSLKELEDSGVFYKFIDREDQCYMENIDNLCIERNYKNRDQIKISRETLPDYDNKIKNFFKEHIHEDEEIRYIIEGTGFFDIRNIKDEWIRIQVEKSDLLVLPAGIYHRFCLDKNDFINALRLFKDDPKWTPLYRSKDTDKNSYRTDYLSSF